MQIEEMLLKKYTVCNIHLAMLFYNWILFDSDLYESNKLTKQNTFPNEIYFIRMELALESPNAHWFSRHGPTSVRYFTFN